MILHGPRDGMTEAERDAHDDALMAAAVFREAVEQLAEDLALAGEVMGLVTTVGVAHSLRALLAAHPS